MSTDDGGTQTSTTSPLTAGSTGEEPGSSTTDGGESSSSGLMCGVGEVECAATCCIYDDEICLAGVCDACDLIDDFDFGLPPWPTTGDWDIYFAAPESCSHLPTPFGNAVFGTNGNRVTGGGQCDAETETSEALTTQVVAGDQLRFQSWHVDEGGLASGADNKVVQLLIGGMFYTLVNCQSGVNPQAFCDEVLGPRAANDWDTIVLDIPPEHRGMSAQIRFRYLSGNANRGFEQGWYIDELRNGDECGPPT